jgi:hypothetical protein
MFIEGRLAIGLATVRTMVKEGGATLAASLRESELAVTEMAGKGRDGNALLTMGVGAALLGTQVVWARRLQPVEEDHLERKCGLTIRE